MPFIESTNTQAPLTALPDPVEEKLNPSASEVISEVMSLENSVVSLFNSSWKHYELDVTYDPVDVLKGTVHEDLLEEHVGDRNEQETRDRMAAREREWHSRRVAEEGGPLGTIVGLASGMLDPTILIPGGAFVKGARGGINLLKTSRNVAAASGAAVGIQEGVLQGTQETRTAGESAINIGGGVVLGGVLGAGAGALLSRAQRNALAGRVEEEMFVPGEGQPDVFVPGTATLDTGQDALLGLRTLFRRVSDGFKGKDRVVVAPVNSETAGRISAEFGKEGKALDVTNYSHIVTADALRHIKKNHENFDAETSRGQIAVTEEDVALLPEIYATPDRVSVADPARDGTLRIEYEKHFSDGRILIVEDVRTGREQLSLLTMRKHIVGKRQQRKLDVSDGTEGPDVSGTTPPSLDVRNDPSATAEESIPSPGSEFKGPSSVGAAAKNQDEENQLKGALGLEKGLKFQDPMLRLQNSESEVARRHVQELAETPLSFEKNAQGEATAPEGLALGSPGSVETRIKQWNAPLAKGIQRVDQAFLNYRKGARKRGPVAARGQVAATSLGDFFSPPTKLTYRQFKEEIGRAMRRNDTHEIPEVADAGRFLRRELFDPLKDRAIEAKLLDESVDVTTADSYLNRVYDKELIVADRVRFRSIIDRWLRAERANAQRAVDEAQEASEGLLARADRSDEEIQDVAEEIVDRILGTPDGRLPYDANLDRGPGRGSARPAGARGPIRARVFNIPDRLIEDFLENDVEHLARVYTRTLGADVEIAQRFGDVELTTPIKEISEDFNRKINQATTPKERQSLDKQKNAAIRDLAGIRDRLRGTYAIPSDPNGLVVRGARVVRSLNYLRLLGGMTLSAIPDIARPVMVNGFRRVFGDGFLPMISNLSQFRLAADEVKLAGTALDMVLDSRSMAIADVMDDFGRHSKFERGIQSLSSNFGIVSLMAPWNAAMKQFTGVVSMTRILQAAERVRTGKASSNEIEHLAASGIDRNTARRIANEFSKTGEKTDGVYFANTQDWNDRSAVEAFRSAVVREVDRTIVTPGQERPLWISTELGKVIGQFKSFALASSQRTLIAGLQQRDMATLNGAAMMMGLGALTYFVKQSIAGRDVSDDPKVWMVEAFDKSGLAGWFMDVNNITEKATRGTVGLAAITGRPVSRFANRNVVGSVVGPSAGLLADAFQAAGAASQGDIRESDVRAFRRLIPLNNVFYTRKLFDEAQEGVSNALGAKD